MSAESALILLAVVVICGPAVVVGILFAVAYFTASRRVDAILCEEIDQRREAAERSDPKESFDLAVDEAILLTHEVLDDFEDDDAADDFNLWEEQMAGKDAER